MKFLKLARGSHKEGQGKGCAMEAVSALNGEMWSDRPECVDPVIGDYVRLFNDFLPEEQREKYLAPTLLISLIGTRGTKKDEDKRSYIAVKLAYASFDNRLTLTSYPRSTDTIQIVRYAFTIAVYDKSPHQVYSHCVKTIQAMVAAGPHAPVEPKFSFEEISHKFGGFVEVV